MSIPLVNRLSNGDKQNKVHVYLRNYKKIAILVSVYTPILNQQLKNIVSKKFQIQAEKLAVFINGIRIDKPQEQIINLKDKSIVHVVHLQRTNLPQITIFFKSNDDDKSILKVKTTPQTLIKQILQKEILPYFERNEKDIFLAYLGKPINIFKTIKQQFIQNQCQILLLSFKKKLSNHIQLDKSKREVSVDQTINLGMPNMGGRSMAQIMSSKRKKPNANESVTAPEEEKKESSSNVYQKKQEVAPSESSQSESVAPIQHSSFLNKQYSAFKQLQQKPQKNLSNLQPINSIFKKKPIPNPSPSPQ